MMTFYKISLPCDPAIVGSEVLFLLLPVLPLVHGGLIFRVRAAFGELVDAMAARRRVLIGH